MPTTTTAAPTTTTTEGEPTLVDPAAAAKDWITAIADGNDEAAIALTSSRSIGAVGGADGFRQMDIELAEGWGAWGHADGVDITAVDLPSVPGTALVVLHGEVSQEGPPEESWAALPVVATADGDRIEPFLDLGDVDVSPENGSAIAPEANFGVTGPDGADLCFVLDDGPSVGAAALAAHAPLASGLHALTVVASNAEGVSARTFTYTVNG